MVKHLQTHSLLALLGNLFRGGPCSNAGRIAGEYCFCFPCDFSFFSYIKLNASGRRAACAGSVFLQLLIPVLAVLKMVSQRGMYGWITEKLSRLMWKGFIFFPRGFSLRNSLYGSHHGTFFLLIFTWVYVYWCFREREGGETVRETLTCYRHVGPTGRQPTAGSAPGQERNLKPFPSLAGSPTNWVTLSRFHGVFCCFSQ